MKSDLQSKHCEACEGIGSALTPEQIKHLLPQLSPLWTVNAESTRITREFRFADFYETMCFINALAWIANSENHHPDLEAGYNYCKVHFMTHALHGLTHNDFICAAKTDALLE